MSSHARGLLIVFVAFAGAVHSWTPGVGAQSPSCFAITVTGDVQGQDLGRSCAFLGIPFAAPPIGSRRWKPPQPAAPWAGVLTVNTPPVNCSTINFPAGTLGGVEDCLRLNIWVRDPFPAAPAPVIVWFHTGAFFGASNNFPGHNGRRLAEETGAIVVAPNYRLGPFGFLVQTALAAEDPSHPVSGNYGLLDQRAALVWVRNNIARFGGDPDNVTIAGTSAGGDSTGLHLVSPDSGPLFHRAIVQSGTPTLRWQTHAEAAAQGDAFATALGCTDPTTVLACLRSKTREQVLLALPQATQQVAETGRVYWLPVVDGIEIPDQPRGLFQAGRFRQVPTIVGFTRDEGWGNFIRRSFETGVSLSQYEAWVGNEFGTNAAAVLAAYPAAAFASPVEAMARLVGDGQFVCEGQRLAGLISEAHAPAFVFSYEHEIDDLALDHVIHGVESNILFGNNYEPPIFATHPLDATDQTLHAAMAGYWTRFASTGTPNVDDDSVMHWPLFKEPLGPGRGANKYLAIKPVIEPGKRLSEAQCAFWEPFYFRTMFGSVPAGRQ